MEPHICNEENADKFYDWLLHRGGLFIWRSVNLSNPGASWTSPATEKDGVTPYGKPSWQALESFDGGSTFDATLIGCFLIEQDRMEHTPKTLLKSVQQYIAQHETESKKNSFEFCSKNLTTHSGCG